tara:strand:+ start:288 stop:524 length:237 start_codon:yes stop_codon:yes gene_type:complete
MRKIVMLVLVSLPMILQSCGGEECYKCRKDSYYNGINYTDPGPWTWRCPKDGESEDAYEKRIKDEIVRGYSCKKEVRK